MSDERRRWIEEQITKWLGGNAFQHELANAYQLGILLRDAMAVADATHVVTFPLKYESNTAPDQTRQEDGAGDGDVGLNTTPNHSLTQQASDAPAPPPACEQPVPVVDEVVNVTTAVTGKGAEIRLYVKGLAIPQRLRIVGYKL